MAASGQATSSSKALDPGARPVEQDDLGYADAAAPVKHREAKVVFDVSPPAPEHRYRDRLSDLGGHASPVIRKRE